MCYGQRKSVQTIGMRAVLLLALAGYCPFLSVLEAGEVVEVAAIHRQGVYRIDLKIVLDAPFEDVHHVITDYVHMYRLNPAIVETEVMYTPDEPDVRVRTLINDCILMYCWEILRVERVREVEIGDIDAVIVPELSNVKSGSTKLKIEPVGDKTLIDYSALLEPDFFVPPLIGSYMVKQKLYKVTLNTFLNVERIARIRNVNQEAKASTLSKSP